MITKMTRFDFILLSSGTEDFLLHLQELGVVDITRSVKAVDETSAGMLSKADDIKNRIAWLEAENFSKDEVFASLTEQLKAAETQKAERAHWGEFSKETLDALEKAGQKVHFFSCSRKKFDSSWQEQLPLQVIEDNGSTVWFVIPGDIDGFPLTELPAPEGSVSESEYLISGLKGKLAARGKELRDEKKNIPEMQAEYRKILCEADMYFAEAACEEAAEGTLTLITGFAPTERAEELCKEFENSGVLFLSEEAKLEDNPPIKLKNNKFVSMFEVLTDMYGRPAYDGFDPTPFISIFFLLFFAMCMGDAGYGIILVIVGLLLRKVKSFSNLAPLVVTLGVGTFVVGFFFHTFFSMDISKWNCIPDALKSCMVPAKVGTYDGAMILALVIGIIHLCLAMIVKTVNSTKNKGFLDSLETWGWTLLIVGGVVLGAVALAGVIDSAVTKIAVIALGAISAVCIFLLNDLHRNPLKNIGAGLWATYNTATGVLGDVLSYLRLYALGLAGGMLGFAFNNLATMALGDGGLGWIPFILITVIGHTLNLAMAALGAFVHPLRLNFLEFFKNSGYEGVGRSYNPLQKNN